MTSIFTRIFKLGIHIRVVRRLPVYWIKFKYSMLSNYSNFIIFYFFKIFVITRWRFSQGYCNSMAPFCFENYLAKIFQSYPLSLYSLPPPVHIWFLAFRPLCKFSWVLQPPPSILSPLIRLPQKFSISARNLTHGGHHCKCSGFPRFF